MPPLAWPLALPLGVPFDLVVTIPVFGSPRPCFVVKNSCVQSIQDVEWAFRSDHSEKLLAKLLQEQPVWVPLLQVTLSRTGDLPRSGVIRDAVSI